MEMQFDKIPAAYLQKLVGQTRTQEQTQEVRLPEDLPDIGRVLGAWGQVVVRGKEWNGEYMTVSSGVMAWVLYVPENGDGIYSVEAWLPFTMKWDLPEARYDGKIFTSCLLKSVDARSISDRKLMVRAAVSALGEAWLPTHTEYAVSQGVPEDVELLTNIYPVMLPKETGEKAFVLEEQIHLPAGAKMEKLMYYTLQPEILDKKVMAGKVVFRGTATLHILYRGEDGRLYTHDCEIPFSQFADLDGQYNDDAALSVWPCVTALDLSRDADGNWQLQAGILGQYLLSDHELVSITEDAYSPGRQVTASYQEVQLPSILDQAIQIVPAEASVAADVQQLVDLAFYPSYGVTERTPNGTQTSLPGQFQMLYYDHGGELNGLIVPWEGQWCWNLDQDAAVQTCMSPTGKPQAIPGVGMIALRSDVQLDAVAAAGEGIRMITGLTLGEKEKPNPNRPSLILCKKGGRRLWDVAKENGTTVAKIMQANGLAEEPRDDAVLLIPVV